MTRLALLVPTIAGREYYLDRLLTVLQQQGFTPGVDVLIDRDDGEVSIGEKRNRLLRRAAGFDFLAFCDDDDTLHTEYRTRVLEAATDDVDVLGFRSRVFIDGVLSETVVHSYSPDRVACPRIRGVARRDRPPNHLNPVRVALARRAGFPEQNYHEDTEYAYRLALQRPRECFLDFYAYDHLFRSDRTGEVTNVRRVRVGD